METFITIRKEESLYNNHVFKFSIDNRYEYVWYIDNSVLSNIFDNMNFLHVRGLKEQKFENVGRLQRNNKDVQNFIVIKYHSIMLCTEEGESKEITRAVIRNMINLGK